VIAKTQRCKNNHRIPHRFLPKFIAHGVCERCYNGYTAPICETYIILDREKFYGSIIRKSKMLFDVQTYYSNIGLDFCSLKPGYEIDLGNALLAVDVHSYLTIMMEFYVEDYDLE